MATKISELTAAGALTGTETVPVVQSSTTKRTTAQAIADLAQAGSSVTTPDTPPGSPNAADYEFDATSTSLPSGWAWVNQGSATYVEQLGIGALDLPAGGADEARHIVQTIPAAGSFTLIVKFTHLSPGSGLFQSRHIVLRDSATDKQMRFSRGPPGRLDLARYPLRQSREDQAHDEALDFVSQDGVGWLSRH